MRLVPIIKGSLLLVILTITFSACDSSDEVNTATLSGTMTLQTRAVVAGSAEKFGTVEEAWVNGEVTTTAKVTFDERAEGIFIEFKDWFGEGAFDSAPAMTEKSQGAVGVNFEVTLHEDQISSGTVITGTVINLVDKNGGLGDRHNVTLHLKVVINGQTLDFHGLKLTGSGDFVSLETPTASQIWVDANGGSWELRIQSIEKDLSALSGFGSTFCSMNSDCTSFVCDGGVPTCVNDECACVCTNQQDCSNMNCTPGLSPTCLNGECVCACFNNQDCFDVQCNAGETPQCEGGQCECVILCDTNSNCGALSCDFGEAACVLGQCACVET